MGTIYYIYTPPKVAKARATADRKRNGVYRRTEHLLVVVRADGVRVDPKTYKPLVPEQRHEWPAPKSYTYKLRPTRHGQDQNS